MSDPAHALLPLRQYLCSWGTTPTSCPQGLCQSEGHQGFPSALDRWDAHVQRGHWWSVTLGHCPFVYLKTMWATSHLEAGVTASHVAKSIMHLRLFLSISGSLPHSFAGWTSISWAAGIFFCHWCSLFLGCTWKRLTHGRDMGVTLPGNVIASLSESDMQHYQRFFNGHISWEK